MPHLYLPAAVQIVEYHDSLQKATNALAENDFNAIGQIAKQQWHNIPVIIDQLYQISVEFVHAAVTSIISCVNVLQKDNFVSFAIVLDIMKKCAVEKNLRPTAKFLASKINEAEAQLGAIGLQVGGRTETVSELVTVNNDCFGILRLLIDTRANWTVVRLHY